LLAFQSKKPGRMQWIE